jgi:uncharacterized RDD family membrane protein YckC
VTLRLTCVNHPASEAVAVRCASCLRPFCRDCVRRRGTFYYCTSCEPAGKVDRPVAVRARGPRPEPNVAVTLTGRSKESDEALETASVGARVGAFVVDVAIVSVAVVIVIGLFRMQDDTAQFMVACALAVAYEALFVQRIGKTPGKALVGVEVVGADGGAAGDLGSWARAFLKIGQLGCCGATFVAVLASRERRAIHDLIAGTRVVRGSRRELAA